MSARFDIPARMEAGVLTLLVVIAASVLQNSRENIAKVTISGSYGQCSFKEMICMISEVFCICFGRMKIMGKCQRDFADYLKIQTVKNCVYMLFFAFVYILERNL